MAKKPIPHAAPATHAPSIPAADSRYVIPLSLVRSREDGGKTQNYHVFEVANPDQAKTSMKNEKGETVVKHTIMGGNGTIYIPKALAEHIDTWVLLPYSIYAALVAAKQVTKKGKT